MKPLEEMGKFATVVVDPPWPIPMAREAPEARKNKQDAARWAKWDTPEALPYRSMNMAEIGRLGIETILSNDSLYFAGRYPDFFPMPTPLLVSGVADIGSRWSGIKTPGFSR